MAVLAMAYPVVPPGLQDLIQNKFNAAEKSGALNYYPTEVTILKIHDIPFQLRFSPALVHKPTTKDSSCGKKDNKKPFDPFESPPEELFICDLAPHHFLVLNKFAIIPEHFILATKVFKEQTDLLEEADLAAVHALVKAWLSSGSGKELFAFFNSGAHSGASQRHRHVQFLPVEGMRAGLNDGEEWEVLLDRLSGNRKPDLPFAYFVTSISDAVTPQELHALYIRLYEQACGAVIAWSAEHPEAELIVQSSGKGNAVISYNLGMTNKALILCPRRAEGLEIGDADGHGLVTLNGTLLAGTLLVKNKMEWNTLRDDEAQLQKVLEAIGISRQAS